jgi:WD40 repeat protein
MRSTSLRPPSRQSLINAEKTLLDEFDPAKFSFLNSNACWEENPKTTQERIINEIFYQIWRHTEDKRLSLLLKIISPLTRQKSWPAVKRLKWALLTKPATLLSSLTEDEVDRVIIQSYSAADRPEEFYPFLLILDVLAWMIQYESLRIATESIIPEWDAASRAYKKDCTEQLQALKNLLECLPESKEAAQLISSSLNKLMKASPEITGPIPKLIHDEDKLTKTIQHLLQKCKDSKKRDECYFLITEKIHPPMGVATLTSPAFLYPCSKLLVDDSIEISSGIQYQASVILSVLQDPRSTEILKKALDSFPLHLSKIRENLIYALGNLKEKRAAAAITRILEAPDEIKTPQGFQKGKTCPVINQKEEALWAMGKIGFESLEYLPILVKYVDHPSEKIKTYLAWALGEMGKVQKERLGGVSAEIVIALLRLLKTKNRTVFEETVSALRKIDIPEFTHSLYIYHVGAVSILGLKPAQKGLFELSETLYHLFDTKKRALIAVNGDSGTGKTYFCEAIMNGFGDVKPNEILYLMRDRKKDHKIFNGILGLKWLKQYIEPDYYQDYPIDEQEDDPEQNFSQFLEQNSDKKLIILDGCRDRHYFQKVIDSFYFQGALDVEVNFRATFSTRRMNLEEREKALESINTHLSFLEEPPLEDTHFYQEGHIILYDLDNSIFSRLNSQEIQEVFEKKRIDTWGELIRLGDFKTDSKPLNCTTEKPTFRRESLQMTSDTWPSIKTRSFSPQERKFQPILNGDLSGCPNLLQSIAINDLKARRIQFYAQDQIAGIGDEGSVFVMTFLDNRIFHTLSENNRDMALLGRDIFLINEKGELVNVSFERNEISIIGTPRSPALSITSFPGDRIITGHEDGSIRVYDFLKKQLFVLMGHRTPVISLAMDHYGRVYSGSPDNSLKRWDPEKGEVKSIDKLDGVPMRLSLYPQDRMLTITQGDNSLLNPKENSANKVRIIDFNKEGSRVLRMPFRNSFSGVKVNFDGRIIAGLLRLQKQREKESSRLAIISPGKENCYYTTIDGHSLETRDCLIMGPKIITCGRDNANEFSIRIWGSEFYVRMKSEKLALQ